MANPWAITRHHDLMHQKYLIGFVDAGQEATADMS
jgi:hypothetical protein